MTLLANFKNLQIVTVLLSVNKVNTRIDKPITLAIINDSNTNIATCPIVNNTARIFCKYSQIICIVVIIGSMNYAVVLLNYCQEPQVRRNLVLSVKLLNNRPNSKY